MQAAGENSARQVDNMNGKWGVVIVAAGRGTRMGTSESKQYLLLRDKPILVHTLEMFNGLEEVGEIVVVAGDGEQERCRELASRYGLSKVKAVVSGGSERQHSVYNGIQVLGNGTDWVMVHDAVRPFVTPSAVKACCLAAEAHGAAVLAVPVKDTIKQVDQSGIITATPDRSSLWAIQTPQAFRRDLLTEAHERARAEGFLGTDDAMVVEHLGKPVAVAQGDYTNIKITTPEDLPYAEFLLEQRMKQHRHEEGQGEG